MKARSPLKGKRMPAKWHAFSYSWIYSEVGLYFSKIISVSVTISSKDRNVKALELHCRQ